MRAQAPAAVTRAETLDFRTLLAEPGGLFDYKLFGPGTVIDAPPLPDDAPVKPRTRFARIELAARIAHPLLESVMLEALPVLPPDLRPLTRLDDDRWQRSAINDHYIRILNINARWASQPAPLDLANAIATLFENEDRPQPVVDGEGTPRQSLRGLAGGTAGLFAALAELDQRLGRDPDAALTGRLYRARCVLFAMGFALRPSAASG